jgi:hypothetical protein
MARIRTIKPEFWDDEKMSRYSLQSNLVYIGMWNFCDDEGIIRRNANWIKSKIFPHREDMRLSDVKGWIKELEDAGLLIPFEYNFESYYLIPTFKIHQRIDKPQTSKIPRENIEKLFQEYSKNVPRTFPSGKERKGEYMEGNERTMSELKIEDCKLPESDMGYKVIDASIRIYKGFVMAFPNNKDLPLKKTSEWVPFIRKLMEQKKYTYDQVAEVAQFALTDKFWKNIVIDAESLEKHFEKLKIQLQNDSK